MGELQVQIKKKKRVVIAMQFGLLFGELGEDLKITELNEPGLWKFNHQTGQGVGPTGEPSAFVQASGCPLQRKQGEEKVLTCSGQSVLSRRVCGLLDPHSFTQELALGQSRVLRPRYPTVGYTTVTMYTLQVTHVYVAGIGRQLFIYFSWQVFTLPDKHLSPYRRIIIRWYRATEVDSKLDMVSGLRV